FIKSHVILFSLLFISISTRINADLHRLKERLNWIFFNPRKSALIRVGESLYQETSAKLH
ncbi:hypothetical protein ABH055_10120, partial [Bacteroides ovatus]